MKIKIKRSFTAPLLVLICYILLMLSGFISKSELMYRDNLYLSVIVIQVLIFVIPGIIYCKVANQKSKKILTFRGFGMRKLLFSVFSVCALICISALVKLGLYELGYSSETYSLYAQYIPAGANGLRDVMYIILAIAVLPSVTEEFVFRGIVLTEYRKSGCKTKYAILLSSFLFAMLHFSVEQFPVYFIGGIVFSLVYIVTDSLPAAMTAHIFNNAFSLLFETSILRIIIQSSSIIFVLFIFFGSFLIFFTVALQLAEKIMLSRALRGEDIAKPNAMSKNKGKMSADLEAVISPTFIACILLFILRVLKVI